LLNFVAKMIASFNYGPNALGGALKHYGLYCAMKKRFAGCGVRGNLETRQLLVRL
jgi:hypothetical protein